MITFLKVAILSVVLSVSVQAQQDLLVKTWQGPLTIVELFTSQGCSSCPPADEVLTSLSSRSDILALSWAVDYWDRLGWKDTFGDPLFSHRQKAYNKRLGRGGVYTPQIVVNGRYQAVGSRRDSVSKAILKAKDQLKVAPSIRISGAEVQVDLPATDLTEEAAIHIIWYLSSADVSVGQGENRGRQLHYTNIVRRSDWMTDWDGQAKKLTIPVESLASSGADSLAILVQSGYGDGPMLGAAAIKLIEPSIRQD